VVAIRSSEFNSHQTGGLKILCILEVDRSRSTPSATRTLIRLKKERNKAGGLTKAIENLTNAAKAKSSGFIKI